MKKALKIVSIVLSIIIFIGALGFTVIYILDQRDEIDADTLPIIKSIPIAVEFFKDEVDEIEEEEEIDPADLFAGDVTVWPEDVSETFAEFTGGTIDNATEMSPNDRYEKAWIIVYENVTASEITSYLSELEDDGWTVDNEAENEYWIINGATKDEYEVSIMHRIDDNSLNLELITK